MPQTSDSSDPSAPPTWPRLRECIAGRRPPAVIELLAPFAPSELKHLHAELKALHTELRRRERTEYREAYDQYAPLLAAALMCAQTPAQAASWLTRPMLLHATWSYGPDSAAANANHAALLWLLTERREPDWTGDLACRIAAGLRVNPDRALWEFAHGLAEHSKVEVPLTDGYVSGWVAAGSRVRYGLPRGAEYNTLLVWLLSEPRLGEYAVRMFEVADTGAEFADSYADRFYADNEWPKVLAKLAAEGVIDRGELLDACAARLLRGDRPGSLRGHLKVHDQLAPTAAEVGERLSTYLGMAASAPAPAAKAAQRELRALDTVEPLDPDTLAALCADVFARSETGLADQQLNWIDTALKRDPGTAPLLLPALAAAFAHPAAAVQQRALKLTAEHTDKASPDAAAELRAAALHIDPALRGEAERILASVSEDPAPTADEPAPAALPPYQPTPMPPAL